MNIESTKYFIGKLSADQDFAKKFKRETTVDSLVSLMRSEGFECTKQEFDNRPGVLTDDELAEKFGISVQTIRLDRLELKIPELRERVKNVAKEELAQISNPDMLSKSQKGYYFFSMGLINMKEKNLDAAEEYLKRAVGFDLETTNDITLLNLTLAQIYYKKNQYQEAYKYLEISKKTPHKTVVDTQIRDLERALNKKSYNKKNKLNLESIKQHICVDDAAIESGDLQRIISPVWSSVSIYKGEKQYNSDLEGFSKAQRYIFAIQWYTAEVNNGGHDQFYYNSTGIVWRDALLGFEQIGHKQAYRILKESADRLGGTPSMDRFERQEQLDHSKADFEDLDREFYEINDIDDKVMSYIRLHKTDFFFNGTIDKIHD
jgi:predicted ribosomally synthesized peptide with nif11-like leader